MLADVSMRVFRSLARYNGNDKSELKTFFVSMSLSCSNSSFIKMNMNAYHNHGAHSASYSVQSDAQII
jgi:hypothetical protein